jgi:hypothetical protein
VEKENFRSNPVIHPWEPPSRFHVSVPKVQRFWVLGSGVKKVKGSGIDSTAFDKLRLRAGRGELVIDELLS